MSEVIARKLAASRCHGLIRCMPSVNSPLGEHCKVALEDGAQVCEHGCAAVPEEVKRGIANGEITTIAEIEARMGRPPTIFQTLIERIERLEREVAELKRRADDGDMRNGSLDWAGQ